MFTFLSVSVILVFLWILWELDVVSWPLNLPVSFPKTSMQQCKPGINIGITALHYHLIHFHPFRFRQLANNVNFPLSGSVAFPGLHVIFSFWSPPVWASSSVFHYVSYSWKFWRVQTLHSVGWPSTWVCLMVIHDQAQAMDSQQEDRKMIPHISRYKMSTWPFIDKVHHEHWVIRC